MKKANKKDAIAVLAQKAGKTTEGLIEQALKDVLAKASVDDLQRVGIVSGKPKDGKTDRTRSVDLVTEIFGDSLKKQVAAGVANAVRQMCAFVLHERLYVGLGANFRMNEFYSRAGLRKLVLEMKLVRRRFVKLAKDVDDPKRPYYWRDEYPSMFAKHDLNRIDRLIAKVADCLPRISEADVKAFAAKTKKEVTAMEKRTKGRTCPFDWLTPLLYDNLCKDVLDNGYFEDGRLTIKPYALVTKDDLVSLLSWRYVEMTDHDKALKGPSDRMFPKSYHRECIRDIRRHVGVFPKDIQKEAKALAETLQPDDGERGSGEK